MILRLLSVILIASVIATVALAPLSAQVDPAVSEPVFGQPIVPGPDFVNTADPVLPGAEEVVGDVQSAMFWSRFQRGSTNDWSYVVFPDGSAKVMQGSDQRIAKYSLTCTSGVSCVVTRLDGTTFSVLATGSARPDVPTISDGEDLSRYLAEWILAGTKAPPQLQDDDSKSDARATEKPEARPLTEASVAPGDKALVRPVEETAVVLEGKTVEAGPENLDQQASVAKVPAGAAPASEAREDTTCIELPGFVPDVCNPPSADSGPKPARSTPASNNADPGAVPAQTPADEAEEEETFLQRANLQCYITGSFSLRYTDPDTQSTGPGKPRVNVGCSGRITPRLSFQVFLREYLKPEQQQPWDPDFTYAFTLKVSEWFSLSYSNYLARFDGPNGEGNVQDSLTKGYLRGNFKLPRYELPNGEAVACVVGIGFPKIPEERLTLACGMGVTKKLRIGATAYLYFPGQQDTYQPDFSYTASYKISEKYRLSYSNYSNNRWTFNQGDDPGPGFVGGSLSLTYIVKF